MIDVCSRSEPKLCTIFPTRVHDRKVVLLVHQDGPLLLIAQFGDATDQQRNLQKKNLNTVGIRNPGKMLKGPVLNLCNGLGGIEQDL